MNPSDAVASDIPAAESAAPATFVQTELPGVVTPRRPISIDNPLTLEFRSPELLRLAQLAFSDRIETLAKLAKDNEAKGYPREAQLVKADRDALQEDLLPQLNMQMSLLKPEALNFVTVCEQVIGAEVRRLVREKLVADFLAREKDEGVDVTRLQALQEIDADLTELETIIGPIIELTARGVVPLLSALYRDAFTKGRLQYSETGNDVLQLLAVKLLAREAEG